MTDVSTVDQTRETTQEKTPVTRLLDLLAGWSDFVSTDEEQGLMDSRLSAEEIGALYQEAGSIVGAPDEAQQVHQFVLTRVLPLLLRE